MSKIITGNQLAKAIETSLYMTSGSPSCVEGIKYDFKLGPMFLKSKFKFPVNYLELSSSEKKDAVIEPGEVVFVLTEERLCLPSNIFIQLSPKRKLSHAGILILGGFAVDPGYQGKLLFGLYNFSSTPFPIIPGKKLVGAVFYELDEDEINDFPEPPPPLDDFPEELIRIIKEYEPIALNSIDKSLQELRSEIADIRCIIDNHNNWSRKFEEYLDKHNDQIGKLSKSLEEEINARKLGQDSLSEAVNKLTHSMSFLKGAAWLLGGIAGLVLTLFGIWLSVILMK